MKRKNTRKAGKSSAKKPKLDVVFPIDSLIANPGFGLVSQTIFKHLNLQDVVNCRLVSKSWKDFIDNDRHWYI